jgi:ribose-phosphate pyrophosphokinase
MTPLLFTLPGNEAFSRQLQKQLNVEAGELELHRFPDGEVCPRLLTSVKGRTVILLAALDRPDDKIMALYLCASVARELGAANVGLVIPYMPYMRQDARFREGEGITSDHFAGLIASCCDWLVTVDPHLHRHPDLSAHFGMPAKVVHAAPAMARWITEFVDRPLIVGPDDESRQWVADVAERVGCAYVVMQKHRSGDLQVEVTMPGAPALHGCTPVLVDDIASTARTLIAATREVLRVTDIPPVCAVVHALFAGDAEAALRSAGAARIVSCNTVAHSSSEIDVCPEMAAAISAMLLRFQEA